MAYAQVETGAIATSSIATTNATVTLTDYAINNAGLVTFSVAPLTSAALTWTGTYNWYARFDDDSIQLNNFMYQFHELKKLTFTTVKSL